VTDLVRALAESVRAASRIAVSNQA
jgi:hypothetical protein